MPRSIASKHLHRQTVRRDIYTVRGSMEYSTCWGKQQIRMRSVRHRQKTVGKATLTRTSNLLAKRKKIEFDMETFDQENLAKKYSNAKYWNMSEQKRYYEMGMALLPLPLSEVCYNYTKQKKNSSHWKRTRKGETNRDLSADTKCRWACSHCPDLDLRWRLANNRNTTFLWVQLALSFELCKFDGKEIYMRERRT